MNAPIIYLNDIVASTFTNVEGDKLYAALAPYLKTGKSVRLSLHNATPMSSSFLNSSFGELVERHGISTLRSTLKLVDFLPSHAATIKQYVDAVCGKMQPA